MWSPPMDLRVVDKTISVLVWLIATIIGFNQAIYQTLVLIAAPPGVQARWGDGLAVLPAAAIIDIRMQNVDAMRW